MSMTKRESEDGVLWHLCRAPLWFGEFARFHTAAELFLLHLALQPRLSPHHLRLHLHPPLTLAHRGPKVDRKRREGRPLTRASGLWSRASRLSGASSEIPGIYKRISKVCERTRANISPLATLPPPLFKFLLPSLSLPPSLFHSPSVERREGGNSPMTCLNNNNVKSLNQLLVIVCLEPTSRLPSSGFVAVCTVCAPQTACLLRKMKAITRKLVHMTDSD